MHPFLDLVLAALAVCAAIPSLWFFIECMLGSWVRPNIPHLPSVTCRTAILMPAHNESTGIAATLQKLAQQLDTHTELWVVADNCSDNTAQLARELGAHVLERTDPSRRGKGYALAFGIEHLAHDPPDVVVIVDADCEVSPHGIARLAQRALGAGLPIQADYQLIPSAQPSARSVVSTLAFLVKNRVRPSGLSALGQPCLLTGTGMAFPWNILRKAPPTDDHLVEDMVMGLELAMLGYAPQLCPEVSVTSALPEQERAASAQRKRWEHGHLAVSLSYVPRLLRHGLMSGRTDLIVLALDLLVPPLSLLVLSLVAGCALCALATLLLSADSTPLAAFVLSLSSIVAGVGVSWYAHGRTLIRAQDLLAIPRYILWKLPLYLGFFLRRKQRVWERTERT
jgi:cellulose synthase/poly-beta-1,6-N-acetylglucosamine synthase-like glycosyltransferase